MGIRISDVPEDILLEVLLYLTVTDLLSLKQTCRALHAFGSSDYVWHRLAQRIDLPLDIPPGVALNELSHDELQRIVVQAIRLEANWRRKCPQARRITTLVRDTNDPYVDEMQFVPGGKWLLTAQRHRQMEGRWSSHVVLWSLGNMDDAYRAASMEVTGSYRSSAIELLDDGQSATVAVGVSDGIDMIEIYSFPLQDRSEIAYFVLPTPAPIWRVALHSHPRAPAISPVIHQLAVADGMIAATVVLPGGNSPLQVFLVDVKTAYSGWVDPRYTEATDRLTTRAQPFSISWVRLYAGHLLLVGAMQSSLILRIYRLPKLRRTTSSAAGEPYIDLGPILVESKQPLRKGAEFDDVTRVSLPSASELCVMIFYSFHDALDVGQVTHFQLPFSSALAGAGMGAGTKYVAKEECASATHYFSMPSQTTAQLAQVGPSGRGVWLEHNWDTQRRRIMRYQPRDGHTIAMVLPPDPALPFTPNLCHSLAFDEVTGRVCLGLFNGDVYILDFV
ncbi:hypothetical protein WOLCODRAFT_120067 [Wolfiporia cocos MD-104 SS10]|uniref:F-box domain-containing protein n=1 Tax=Wolfiporia cocos (strain MD-104) TaxID=742152 RepID=A0A2H3JJ20_WOLCO|nr:hypothetical protein WOLCODRAFT_120067 [Wolfiporia cocos MD-104 SS10]